VISVVRGFIPDGLRSNPKTIQCLMPGTPHALVLGQLRWPSGINPLTTKIINRNITFARTEPSWF
jgi:hypothetical protein